MKRLFRGLRDRPPDARYDAVIVGAGIGGLVTANLLAREGLSVLLVEQHYMTGGYCSTFRRGGFTFDAATHFYPLLGNPDTAPGRLLAKLGVGTRWVAMDPVDTFHCPDGSKFVVDADFDAYRARLDGEFPDHRQALSEFFGQVSDAYKYGLLAYFRGHETERFRQLESLTVREVLERTFPGSDAPSRKLKLVLTGDCPHWGSPPDRTSFVFDSMLRLSYFLGNYYPVGGSQAFADELARTFEQSAGAGAHHMLMSTRARAVEVTGGRVSGVEIETLRGPHAGRRLRVATEHVVSNADLGVTYDLLPPGVVSDDTRRRLAALRPSFPCFLVHIGLRGVTAKALDAVQGYYWNDWDTDQVGRNGLRCKIFCPTVYDDSVAPHQEPQGQVVILQKVLDMAGLEATELGIGATTDPGRWSREQWDRHRVRLEQVMFGHLCQVLPGIEEHVEVKLSATADTSRRFTLNTSGAMLGWEMSPEQLGPGRPGPEGPVPGLSFTGHWVRPGGGIVPTLESAKVAARVVLRGTGVAA